MMEDGDAESWEVLAEHRLGRQGLHVKLDRGFEDGVYCCYVEFEGLAERVGFSARGRVAGEYCELLKAELARRSLHSVDEIIDASRTDDPRRRRTWN